MAIKFEATGDFSQLVKENERYQKALVKLTDQVTRMEAAAVQGYDKVSKAAVEGHGKSARAAKGSSDSMTSATKSVGTHKDKLGSLVSTVGQVAAGYVTWSTAVSMVTDAMQKQREFQDKTLTTQVGQAAEDAKLIQNLVGQTSQQKADTVKSLESLTVDLGIASAGYVKAGFNEAISKSAGDVGLAMDATKRAAELQRATPDALPTYAAGGAVLSKLIGTRDTREAYSLLAETQARSPTASPQELMQELPGAIAAMVATDTRQATAGQREAVRESAALFAAMGQATQQNAAPVATASVQLTAQLEKFFAGKADPGTLYGRIEAVQKNKGLQDELLSNLTGEAKFLPVMKQLVRGQDSEIVRQFRGNVGAAGEPGLQINAQSFEQLRSELSADSTVTKTICRQASEAKRESRTEQRFLADEESAAMAAIRLEFNAAIDEVDRTWNQRLESKLLKGTFEAFQAGDIRSAGGEAISMLDERISRVRNRDYTGAVGSVRRAIWGETAEQDLSPSEKQRIGRLEEAKQMIKQEVDNIAAQQLTEQRAMRLAIERNNELQQEHLNVVRSAPRSGASAAAAAPNLQRQGR